MIKRTAATSIKLRAAAGYRQGVPKFEPHRCDTCAHSDTLRNGKQHGLYCKLHRCACKTHGVCAQWR